ncbi:hypothetical protein A3C26_03090 [Candidatus Daviesbacteria bacterium RIFCSPHIGHO2_02_FULL_39_12]|uniref:PIN domain-containing protein n=2 Tax=Candidatus Daviesiibacteriota TaxID=1752718 RepID=A0A1F5JE28_9BACT|nr:MAG: hypothetical protein A3C26_03090 [Candidatus Daviesbacteria bacterium RIFCSPHIGHO2_02_FULL_39_12]OGE71429.1 MAG: hypothetical protein A3H40_02790 [Candidatus Daviesbacteria bacterium RIFCSPLOWO2_02_FULL_38_15]
MKVVVDSSIIIDYLRGGIKWEKFIASAGEEVELFLPTMAIFELFSGKSTKNPRKLRDMFNFISQFRRMDLDDKIAKRAGEIYRDMSVTLQVPDYIIAASALEINGMVVTLNKKHFEQIPNLILYPL